MFRSTALLSLPLCLLALSQQALALSKRQDAATASIPADQPVTTLEPVLPPDNDPEDFSILNPDPRLNLYYGGLPNATVTKRDDSESGILVNLDFKFLHPSVPLDYSSFISGVSCSDDNTMTGVFSTQEAYNFGKEAWTGLDNILLITSATGCGADSQNDVFLAHSITFSDSDLSFTASGSENLVKDVAETSDITWGNVVPSKLRKRSYKNRGPYSDVVKRLCLTECHYGAPFSVSLGFMLADQEGMEVDPDAPWENAVLLAEFGPQEDDGGEGSEGSTEKTRRYANSTELAERDGFEYGLKLYCVDCGFEGTAAAQGNLGINWLSASVYRADVTLSGQLYVGMFLGLQMYVSYEKTWEKDFVRQYLNPWSIPLVLEFGPYIRAGVQATIEIKAEGNLLLGASATWTGFEANMDFLNPDKSTSSGFEATIERKAEADVEISAEATLGLPVGIGLGVTVFSVWSVDVELTDTPALVAEAAFKASIDANDCEGSGCEEEEQEDDECDGGIAWSVGFRNTLEVSVTGFDPYQIDEWNAPPFAEGCINILGDGGDDNGDGNGDGDPSDGSGDGDNGDGGNGDGTCTAGAIVATSQSSRPRGTYCAFSAGRSKDSSQLLGKASRGGTIEQCAQRCLGTSGCASFGFNTDKSLCRMYSKSVVKLNVARARRSNKVYNDVGCYEAQVCDS